MSIRIAGQVIASAGSLTAHNEDPNAHPDIRELIGQGGGGGGYSKEEIDNKFIVVDTAILGNADAIQKTRSDFMESDSELQQQINAHANELTTQKNDIDELGDQVAEIESKIPEGTSDTNPLINRQQLLDEEMDIREDMMESDSELQTQINALADAIQGGGGGSVPDNVYTQDNLIAGKNIEIEEPAKEIISYSYVPYTLGFGDGPFPELLYSSNKSNPYGTLTYYYLDPELKQYYGYSQAYEASGVLVVTDHSAPPKYLCGVASQEGIPVEVVSSGPRKINCVGAYTQTNLLGGKDIEIVPEPVEGGIDEHTLACWHFDGDTKYIDSKGGLHETTIANGSAALDYTSYYKFGTSALLGRSADVIFSLSDLGVSLNSSFTIEGFLYIASRKSVFPVFGFAGTSNGIRVELSDFISTTSAGASKFAVSSNGTTKQESFYLADNNVASKSWFHVAIVYNGSGDAGVATLYLNGEPISVLSDIEKTTSTLNTFKFVGNSIVVDEVRISNIARYKGQPFTPPTKAYEVAEPTGNMVVNYTGKSGESNASFPLFYHTFSDHLFNDASWLRSDTFSWHSGDIYKSAYEHLAQDAISLFAWSNKGYTRYTKSLNISAGDALYYASGDLADTISVVTENGFKAATGAQDDYIRDASRDVYISSETETIGSTTITYHRATDGHKIVLADQEENISAIFRATGVAWYYILDTENKRFKLPRTKWAFTGLRDGVGNYVEAGLPNITGTFSGAIEWTYNNWSGAFERMSAGGQAPGSSAANAMAVSFDASRSNAIYGKSDTVQPPATEQYIYFYVGNTVRNQTEVDVGTVTEQLNGKQDVLGNNVDYVVETYSDGTNWYRLYKSGWVEQGGVLTLDSYNYSFPKPFAGIPSLSVTRYSVYLGTAVVSDCTGASGTPTSTGFTLSGVNFKSQYFTGGNWSACGQGA